MGKKVVSWSDRKQLRPSTYAWKGRLLSCGRWVLTSVDGRRACEMEYNGRGCTVDYYRYDEYGCGAILTYSSLTNYDLLYRRIYAGEDDDCRRDVLLWVNDWQAPQGGVDGGVVYALNEWGNEVAV
ncbi:MAG: hypothetical protein Q4B54_06650 [Coriobacteriales bacterium]|nr:hypothetical protein [Coriobacteriales bacterium]